MSLPRSVQQIRAANGGLDNLTDFEIAQHEFGRYQRYYDSFDNFAKDIGFDTGGKWGNRLSASVDSYQAGLLGVGEALTGSETLGRARRRNELEAQNARQLAQSQGAVMSYKDVGGVGDALDYVGGLAVDSLPYLGEAAVGGLAGRALLTGGKTALGLSRGAAGTVGAVGASYPSSVGDILQNQREQGGETNLGYALAGGVPYAALNAFGIEGALGRGQLARSGIRALDNMTGLKGGLTRTGASALKGAATEGPSEMGQEFVNQYFGRMAVDPNETFLNADSKDRFTESFIGGAALGGVFGGGAGGWRRSEGYLPPGNSVDEGTSDLMSTDSSGQGQLFGDLGTEGLMSPWSPTQPDGSGAAAKARYQEMATQLGQLQAGMRNAEATGDQEMFYRLQEAYLQLAEDIRPLERTVSAIEANEAQPGQFDLFGTGPTPGITLEQIPNQPVITPVVDRTPRLGMAGPAPLLATADGLVGSEDQFTGQQFDMFGGPTTFGEGQPAAEDAAAPRPDTATQDMFQQTPSAMVPTMFNPATPGATQGERGAVAGNIRSRIVQQLGNDADKTMAVSLSLDLAKTVGDLAAMNAAVDTRAAAVQKAMDSLERKVSGGSNMLDPAEYERQRQVLENRMLTVEAARQLVGEYQTAQTNAFAQEAQAKAGPGTVVDNTTPADNTTEQVMREGSMAAAVAETDARVAQSQADRTANERMALLRDVLAQPTRNQPVSRFRKALRDAGFTNLDLTPDEQAEINRVTQRRDDVRAATVVPPGLAAATGRLTPRSSLNEEAQPTAPDVQPAPAAEPAVAPVPAADTPRAEAAQPAAQSRARTAPAAAPAPASSAAPAAGRPAQPASTAPAVETAATQQADVATTEEAVTADELFEEVRGLRERRQSMLSKAGRAPNEGTKQRDEWDALTELIQRKTQEWAEADSRERRGVAPQRRETREDKRNSEQSQREMEALAKAKPKRAPKEVAMGQPVETLFGMVDSAKDQTLYEGAVDALYRRFMETEVDAETDSILSYVESQPSSFQQDWSAAERRYDETERGVKGKRGLRQGDQTESTKSNIDKDTINALNGLWTRFSQGQAGKGLSVKKVQELAQQALARLGLGDLVNITVVANPQAVGMTAPDGVVPAGVLGSDGKVYLFADNLANELDVFKTVFHELFHLGLSKTLGQGAYIQQMLKFKLDPLVRQYAERWKKTTDGRNRKGELPVNNYEALSVEEALADISEDLAQGKLGSAERKPFVRSLIGKLAGLAQFLGMDKVAQELRRMTYTEAEKYVVDIIAGANYSGPTLLRGQRFSQAATEKDLAAREKSSGVPPQFTQKFKRSAMGHMVRDAAASWRAHPWLLGFLTLDQIKDRFQGFESVSKAVDTWLRMGARANEVMRPTTALHRQWATFTRKNREAGSTLNKLFIDATLAEAWVDGKMEPRLDERNAHLDFTNPEVARAVAEARTKFLSLPEEGRKIYSAVTANLNQQFRDKQEAMLKRVVDVYKDNLAGAFTEQELTKLAQDGKLARAEAAKTIKPQMTTRDRVEFQKFLAAVDTTYIPRNEVPGPYFPLTRRGDHVVVYKSQSFKELENALDAARQSLDELLDADVPTEEAALKAHDEAISTRRKAVAAARKAVEEAKGKDSEYVVEFYDSLSRANDRREELAAEKKLPLDKMPKVIRRQQFEPRSDSLPAGFLSKLQAQMQKELPEGSRADVASLVRQMVIQSMPERSAFKAELKRMRVAGVNPEEAMLSYLSTSHRNAWTISRLENVTELGKALTDARASEDQDERAVGNELQQRYAKSLEYSPGNALIDAATNLSYITHLGFSAGYYFQNMLQPWMVSMPVLAGKYGFGATNKALADASVEVVKAMHQTIKLNKVNGNWEMPLDLDQFQGEERALLERLTDEGRIDITIRADLGVGSSTAGGAAAHVLQKAAEWSSLPAHQVEVVNRVATALAAYRLSRRRGNSFEAALAEADKVVVQTHVDYSLENAPRFMNPNAMGGLGRLTFQFRRYQQAMVFLWGKTLLDAVRGDKDSARALMYLTGSNLAMAGSAGVPIAAPLGLVAAIASQIGDEDEERDITEQFWAGVRGVLGEKGTDLLRKGVPAAIGVDMSARIGAGDILSPIRNMPNANTGQEWMGAVAATLFGASGGTVAGWADAFIIGADNPVLAIQKTLPAGIKSAVEAINREYAANGLTDRKGNVLIGSDELGGVDFLGKLLNLGESTRVTNMYELRSAITEADTKRQNYRSRLMREYTRARLEGDREAMAEARAEIDAYNSRNEGSARILPRNLTASYQQERQRRGDMTGGLRVTKRNRDIAEDFGVE